MIRYLPSTDRSTTVDPRRFLLPIGPPSTTTASLGQSSWNSFKKGKTRQNRRLKKIFCKLDWQREKTKKSAGKNGVKMSNESLTCTATVLVCELMLALVSASGSPHIWQRRLMKAWSGMRTPTSWAAQRRVNQTWLTCVDKHCFAFLFSGVDLLKWRGWDPRSVLRIFRTQAWRDRAAGQLTARSPPAPYSTWRQDHVEPSFLTFDIFSLSLFVFHPGCRALIVCFHLWLAYKMPSAKK